jgi:hypothetical protein
MPVPDFVVDPMAAGILWDEIQTSDSGELNFNAPTSQRTWLVTGTFDPNDVVNTAADNIPQINQVGNITQFLRGFKYGPTEPGFGNSWLVVADYAFQVDYFELNFDTGGGTAKREQALDEGDYYSCRGAAIGPVIAGQTIDGVTIPDFKGLIPDGADVPDSKFEFTVLVRSKISNLPQDYFDTLIDLTSPPHANDRPLRIVWKNLELNFDTEELLFLDAPGKITNDDGFELSLKFSASRSVGNNKGTAGVAPGTQTQSNFSVPAVQATVVVTVLSVIPFTLNEIVFVNGAGRFEITAIGATTLTIQNLGDATNAAPGTVITSGAAVTFDQNFLSVGSSGPIEKPGWRYLKVIAKEIVMAGQRVAQPSLVIVNKVIYTADLSPLGIFS